MERCPKCNSVLKHVKVSVEGAKNSALSFQCPNCDYFEFESASSKKVVEELREKECILKIKQKVIKLSKDRLGIYINNDVARCLDLKSGQEIYTSVPNKNTIVLTIK